MTRRVESVQEQATAFLEPYFDILDSFGPMKVDRNVHVAKLTAVIQAAVLAERESCAEAVSQYYKGLKSQLGDELGLEAAAAIRARGGADGRT